MIESNPLERRRAEAVDRRVLAGQLEDVRPPQGTLVGWRSLRLSIPGRRSLGRNNSFQSLPGSSGSQAFSSTGSSRAGSTNTAAMSRVGVLTIRGVGDPGT